MSSVGSTLKAEVVEQQKLMSTALGSARPPQASATPVSPDEASISQVGRMRGSTMVVQDVLHALAQYQVWRAQCITSSQPDHVEATADSATSGSHQVQVHALAQAQVTSSPSFTSLSTVVGIGTLNIEMGHWSNTSSTFATNPNWPKASVTLGPRDNTLERVRDRINAAGVGVVAAVVSDATGSRLVLSAARSGTDNGFKITADPDVNAAKSDVPPLSHLSYDPEASDGQGMQLTQAAQDASLTVDGRALTSPSNLVDDGESGLQLLLKRPTEAGASLTVQADDEPLQRRLQALAASVNDLRDQASAPATNPMSDSARQQAQSVLSTMSEQLQGPQAAAWRAIGLSWDDQTGMQQQAVHWTPELRQTGQQLFSALSQSEGASVRESAASIEAPAAAETSGAGVAFNRQRLQEQYTDLVAASDESARQDFAVS